MNSVDGGAPERAPERLEGLLAVSAALAARDAAALDAALEGARGTAPPAQVEEVLLQSYLFLGYPVALNGLAAWRRLEPRVASLEADDPDGWPARGADVCATVYGGQYERLRANVRALHPDVERWMVAEGYGKVLGRPGLPLSERELCTVAMLAVIDVPTQLYSHLRGALNAGATPDEVERVLEVSASVSTPEARAAASRTWARVRARHGEEG